MATNVPLSQLQGAGGRFTSRNQGVLWTGLNVLANNINRRGNSLITTRKKAMEKLAKDMEMYAKVNAPWRDVTGMARERLAGVAVHGKEESTAYIGHGVGYGLWLETRNGGSYAIIRPTLEEFRQRVMATVVEFDSQDRAFARVYGG